MARHRTKRINTGSTQAPIPMTSLMDILTCLLLFVLKSVVLEGEVINPMPGVDLPESSSNHSPRTSIAIAIFDDVVMMDGEVVASVSKSKNSNTLLISPLAHRLDESREKSIEIAKLRGDKEEFEGRIAIQGDKDIDFAILQRVMFTCSHSGFETISLAVLEKS
jgi:biopolymer transport protein ExbD